MVSIKYTRLGVENMTGSRLNFLLPFLCLTLSLIYPAAAAEGVKNGLSLAVHGAFPSLFPAFVLSGLFTAFLPTNSTRSALVTPFFLGLLCGFPVGARCLSSLVKEGKITKEKASRLLPFISGASPSFLLSFCTITLFPDKKAGLLLLVMQGAAFSLFFLLFFRKELMKKKEKSITKIKTPPLATALPTALKNAVNSFLYVGACIVFFSFFLSILKAVFPLGALATAIASLLLELTSGVKSLAMISDAIKLPLCAFGIGWNGFSVHLQTAGITSEANISLKFYFLYKVLFAILFFLFTQILQNLL